MTEAADQDRPMVILLTSQTQHHAAEIGSLSTILFNEMKDIFAAIGVDNIVIGAVVASVAMEIFRRLARPGFEVEVVEGYIGLMRNAAKSGFCGKSFAQFADGSDAIQ